MARVNYGSMAQTRTRRLLEIMLAYANDAYDECDHTQPNSQLKLQLKTKWQTQRQLVVKTKVRFLVALMLREHDDIKTTPAHVKASLKHLKDFIEILEDHRPVTRGSDEWHFTLKLWCDRWDTDQNLERFDREWEQRRPAKSKKASAAIAATTAATAKTHSSNSKAAALLARSGTAKETPTIKSKTNARKTACRQDWGNAPESSAFYGRTDELTTLTNWIIGPEEKTAGQRCRLVLLLGMGGMGKTALSIELAKEIRGDFDALIWRSLRNAPFPQDLIADLLQFVENQPNAQPPKSLDEQISQLLKAMQKSRCAIVLDNIESVLVEQAASKSRSSQRAGNYRPGYEGYGQLLRCIGEISHQSCLILTSREKPRGLSFREGASSLIRSWPLSGLMGFAGQSVLQEKEIQATEADIQALIKHYAGNPLALKIVASTIQELFAGDLTLFWQEGSAVFGDIADLLDQHFQRLSLIEKQVMYWLAINREASTFVELKADFIPPISSKVLLETVDSLKQRFLIEIVADSASGEEENYRTKHHAFTQQPVVMEYVSEHFIEQVCTESLQGILKTINTHALIKTQIKDYCRNSQIRLILQPTASQLVDALGSPTAAGQCLQKLIETLKALPPRQPGYAAGNIFNLLWQLQLKISQYDFSGLSISQAYLQGPNLQHTNFSQSDLTHSTFSQTLGSFMSAEFSLEYTLLATGIDNKVCLWRAAEGKALMTCHGHTGWVVTLAFADRSDLMASGSYDQTIKLWNTDTGQCLKTLRGHTSWVQTVAFAPCGGLLASGSYDQTIKLWNVQSGQCLQTLSGHQGRILWVAFTPDGRWLLSASEDKTVRLWSVEPGMCDRVLEIAVNWKLAIALSPSGELLATGSDSNSVKLWQLSTGVCLKTFSDYNSLVWAVAFSPDGQTLATGSEDHTIKLWDVATGRCLKTITDHTQRVWSVKFSPDGRMLASVSDDQSLKLWDSTTCQPLRTLTTYSNAILSVALSPNGQWLASSSKDQFVRLWTKPDNNRTQNNDPPSQHELSRYELSKTLTKQANLINCVTFDQTDQWVATGGVDQTVALWEVTSGECLRTFWGHTGWISAITFSPNGQVLASGSHDKTIKLWDSLSGECLSTLRGHTHRVKAIAFHPMGHQIASASSDANVKLWTTKTEAPESGECLQTFRGHTDSVLSVAFSPDGLLLASSSSDRTVKLWEIETGDCVHTFEGHDNQVNAIAFTPAGDCLISAGEDQILNIWQRQTKKCIKTLSGHTKAIRSLAIGNGGEIVISSSEDETIRIWDIQTGDCLHILRPDRPYEGMNITGAIGLTSAQRSMLKSLGAVEA